MIKKKSNLPLQTYSFFHQYIFNALLMQVKLIKKNYTINKLIIM